MQLDAPLPGVVVDAQVCGRIEVDAVGFAVKCQQTVLLALLPVFQGFDITAAVQAFDRDVADIADGKVAM